MPSHPPAGRLHRVGEILGVGAVTLGIYFVLPLDGDLAELIALAMVIAGAGALVPLAMRRARQVLVSSDPLLVAMQSMVSILMLLIVSFSSAYYVLGTQYDDEVSGVRTKIDALYFTVTTLATVGFGDITATGQFARALATFNMLVNLGLIAVAIRVLSWALAQRRDLREVVEKRSPDDPTA